MRSLDWILFTYITVVMLMQAYLHYSPYWYERHEQDNVLTPQGDMLNPNMKVQPDERGIIGTLTDNQGNEYYAVIIPKDEFERTWTQVENQE